MREKTRRLLWYQIGTGNIGMNSHFSIYTDGYRNTYRCKCVCACTAHTLQLCLLRRPRDSNTQREMNTAIQILNSTLHSPGLTGEMAAFRPKKRKVKHEHETSCARKQRRAQRMRRICQKSVRAPSSWLLLIKAGTD